MGKRSRSSRSTSTGFSAWDYIKEEIIDALGNIHSSAYIVDGKKTGPYQVYEYDNNGNQISLVEYADLEFMEHGVDYAQFHSEYEYDENNNLIGGEEIDSYYSAFGKSMPKCVIK